MDFIIVLIIVSLFFTASAQQLQSNVSRGSSLTPRTNPTWLSRSGLYAFGFYKQGDGYAVGVFLAGIPQKTVVWTAKRDDPPFSSNSTLLFSDDGTLVVKSQVDVAVADSLGSSSASMLNSGNFVIYNDDQEIIWQSFDHPTDTLVPSQRLLAGDQLFSSISDTDHATGIFCLTMQPDGNLVQYPVSSTPDTVQNAYYATQTFEAGDNVTLNLDDDGHLYLLNSTGHNIMNLAVGGYRTGETLYLLRLDADGIFRLYSHNLAQNGNWSVEWKSSSDPCSPKGLCGLNGLCLLNDQQADCVCLPGFGMVHPGNWTAGCERIFTAEDCKDENADITYTVKELSNTILEDVPYSVLSLPSTESCKQACLEDCSCEAALFKDNRCSKQRPPLKYGRRVLNDSTIALIKVSTSTPTGNGTQSLGRNITRGSTLYTNATPSFWPSFSNRFAFGFYPCGNGFKVGIWLIGSPKNTIVWTSRRKDPVSSLGAVLVFSSDGSLHLSSSTGEVQPVADTTQAASVASILDSGNFVLYGSKSEVIWSSFDHPTDTLLVYQKLLPDNFLYSSISETDTSVGNFKLQMQRDGSLYASPVRSLHDRRYAYWSSDFGRNLTLNLASDGRFYLFNTSGASVQNFTEGEHLVDSRKVLYRATFDVDGILRLYQHQMGTTGSSNISILWTAIKEENRCMVKGICGPNSFCTIDGADLSCVCPPGFEFVDPKQANMGCKLNFSATEGCFHNKNNTNYMMTPLPNTAWEPSEYDVLTPVNEEDCSQSCLEDCNCVVATFRDQMCIKEKLPLRFGKRNGSDPTKALVKTITRSLPGYPSPGRNIVNNKLGMKLLIVGAILITFSIVVFWLSGYLIFRYQIWGYRQTNSPDVIGEISLRSFTYYQLVKATNNFREEIGRGASGKVYKGFLAMNSGQEIAVKRLEKMVDERESVFRNEMKIIGRTHHKNLVQLVGFCSEGSSRLLVYEFMKNGSLGDLLFKSRHQLGWNARMKILLDIAKGIHYLHEECKTRIIHCDIKPHNILMDESCCPKISDFGLSKLLKPDQTRTYTMGRGTRGYVAPEWHQGNSPITVKADVYSFGVLLFELVCCRRHLALSAPEEEMVLVDWVRNCYLARKLGEVVGEEEVDIEELKKTVKVGLWCVQTEPALRPSMKSVIMMLQGTILTPAPPPFSHV